MVYFFLSVKPGFYLNRSQWRLNSQFAVDTTTEFNGRDYVSVPLLDDNDPSHPIFVFEHGLVYFTPDGYPIDVIFDANASLIETPPPSRLTILQV